MIAIKPNARLTKWVDEWKTAKKAEQEAQERRRKAEDRITILLADDLPEKGTTNLEGLKIVTGIKEEWDQEKLHDIKNAWTNGVDFPFKCEWKPDNPAIKYIREHMKETYALIKPALYVESKKPLFSEK